MLTSARAVGSGGQGSTMHRVLLVHSVHRFEFNKIRIRSAPHVWDGTARQGGSRKQSWDAPRNCMLQMGVQVPFAWLDPLRVLSSVLIAGVVRLN